MNRILNLEFEFDLNQNSENAIYTDSNNSSNLSDSEVI